MASTIDVIPDRFEGLPPRPNERVTPPTAQALVRLRLRWFWPVATAALGGVFATLLTLNGVTYKSTATVRLADTESDSTRVQQIAQTVANTAESSNVVAAAARARGVSTSDLESRLTAQWRTDTDIVAVTVEDKNADAVPQETTAVVDSLLAYYDAQRRAQIRALRDLGNQLLSDGALADRRAEDTRRSGVGSAIASRQGDAASALTTVTRLEPAETAKRATLSSPIAAGLGVLLGLALGAALALVVPLRRRRVVKAAPTSTLLEGVRVVDFSEIAAAEAAGRFLESERADLVVVSASQARVEAEKWAEYVHVILRAHGLSVALVGDVRSPEVGDLLGSKRGHARLDPHDVDLGGHLALGRAGRVRLRERLGVSSLILLTDDAPESLGLLAGQSEVASAIVLKRRRTRLATLHRICESLRASDPTVVLAK